MAAIPVINVGDVLELKKNHPCGGRTFKVARVGSDIKLICTSCERVLMLDRIKVEKMIKRTVSKGDTND